MPHLFADISSHGFGHLAQAAPVLNRLAMQLPNLQLTLRCGLPREKLQQRIQAHFEHIPAASDFGYVMHDAVTIDLQASAAAYRSAHADFAARVAAEADLLRQLGVDAVFADVAYLPLAGAAQAGIPAMAMCSLNWADLFEHYFGHEDWAPAIHAEILAAYRSAIFLRTTPGMPMPRLDRVIDIDPIATPGQQRRKNLAEIIGADDTARIVLIALGGIPMRLPIERWPLLPDTHWLVPASWHAPGKRFHAIEGIGWPFADLLRSVDAIVAKPGYGTFAEAACNGTAVIYQRRENWPEQDCLVDWLQANARCKEISAIDLAAGNLGAALAAVRQTAVPIEKHEAPTFAGAEMAASHLVRLLTRQVQ